MLFKKLFQVLVLGGAVAGALSGCATTGSTSTAKSPGSTPPPPAESGMGGGVQGW